MRRSYSEIKKKAKSRLGENFGTAFAIVYIPGLITLMITMITSEFTVFLPDNPELAADYIIGTFLGFGAAYISLKLLIQYILGKNKINFNDLFSFDKQFLHFVLFKLIFSIIFVISFIPSIPVLYEIFINVMIMADATAIEQYFRTSDITTVLINSLTITFSMMIILLLIMVRFKFTGYIIIHKKSGLIEAMKKSWEITHGSYFRILLFPLSFILWILLSIMTFGLALFYVSPFMTVANGYMYITLMQENDEQVDFIISPKKIVFDDPLADFLE